VVLPGAAQQGIIITFDDGEQSVYKNAFPLLKEYNMKALVFLIVDYIGKENVWDVSMTGTRTKHLTWDEIHEMSEWGIEFGSHTMSHRNLTHVSEKERETELTLSRHLIEKEVGYCRSLSYPFNRINDTVVVAAQRAGFSYGFGGDGSSILQMKKEAMYITDTTSTLCIKLNEHPGVLYWYERSKQRVINYFTLLTMLQKRSRYFKEEVPC